MATIFANLAEHVTIQRVLFLSCGLVIVKLRPLMYQITRKLRSPLRYLPGPPSTNWLIGHFFKLLEAQGTTIWETWMEQYGKVMQIRGVCGEYHVCIWDMRAINYVLSHNTTFVKSEGQRRGIAMILGEGILSADEESHKRQRRIMNPAFSTIYIRNLFPTFIAKSNQLRDIWMDNLQVCPGGETIDVLPWLNRATLDIIGLGGFGYDFCSLQGENKDELSKAFAELLNLDRHINVLAVIKILIGRILGIRTGDFQRLEDSKATIHRIGTRLVRDKKTLLQGAAQSLESRGQDLLTLLIKSNLAETDNRHVMLDEEVLGQISTFLAAGHETTSSTTAWALYALSKHPNVQAKLHDELQAAGLGDEPSIDELESLSYLHNFVREVLRVYAVIAMASRQVAHDTVIPLEESFTDLVQKGDSVIIPILSINRAKYIWGEDALEFNPERWDNLPSTAKDMPGVWGNILTFLHGPHACIGYRFAIEEIKSLLYALVPAFEFSIDPGLEIEGKTGLATRPCVKSGKKKAEKLPLLCCPVGR